MRFIYALVLSVAAGLSVPVTRHDVLRAVSATVASPAFALSVGEGGLPDGAFQFDRYIKVQAELKRLRTRLKTSPEIDQAEWSALGLFLRRLYDEGDDMVFLTRNLDADKQKAAKALAKDFRDLVMTMDKYVLAKDLPAVDTAFDTTSTLMASLLDLLQNVPDEL